jgi:hypothetical protein
LLFGLHYLFHAAQPSNLLHIFIVDYLAVVQEPLLLAFVHDIFDCLTYYLYLLDELVLVQLQHLALDRPAHQLKLIVWLAGCTIALIVSEELPWSDACHDKRHLLRTSTPTATLFLRYVCPYHRGEGSIVGAGAGKVGKAGFS